jgi:hypothetical protein
MYTNHADGHDKKKQQMRNRKMTIIGPGWVDG